MGVKRREEKRIGEDEGKREWREGHAKGLGRRKERSQMFIGPTETDSKFVHSAVANRNKRPLTELRAPLAICF